MSKVPARLIPHHDPKVREKIAKLYAQGVDGRDLRQRFAPLSQDKFYDILKEFNVPRRSHSPNYDPPP